MSTQKSNGNKKPSWMKKGNSKKDKQKGKVKNDRKNVDINLFR